MAYLTLGPEFYEKEPKLYNTILKRTRGGLEKVINGDIHVIKFDSTQHKENAYCVAVISFSRFHGKPYMKHIISNRFGVL